MCLTKLKIVLILLLTVGFSALLPSRFPEPPPKKKPGDRTKANPQPIRQREEDRALPEHDDELLPAGALARLGTTRLRHGNSIRCLALSPDGKTLVTVAPVEGGEIRLWDLATGKLRDQMWDLRWAHTAVFSPDGRTLAIIGVDKGEISLRRVAAGGLYRNLGDKDDHPSSLAFSGSDKTSWPC